MNPVRGISPALFAAAYPWLLIGFHSALDGNWFIATASKLFVSSMFLLIAFLEPLYALTSARLACDARTDSRFRRLALWAVACPTLYVFWGVLFGLLAVPGSDALWFSLGWVALGVLTILLPPNSIRRQVSPQAPAQLRVLHGVSALLLVIFVAFHLFNHLTILGGTDAHTAVMKAGRQVYRNAWIQPALVTLMLFQVGVGLRLAWLWSAQPAAWWRTFQLASGVYLAVFILGHMNSVFIYARWHLGIETDWKFATGFPGGLIHDAWNIRLVPHYALGVFFVVAHLFSGLRIVLLSHGMSLVRANRVWFIGSSAAAALAGSIIVGMCGWRPFA